MESGRQLRVERLTTCNLCLYLYAVVGLCLDFRESNCQIRNLLRRNDGEVLNVLRTLEAEFAALKLLQQFLYHFYDADTWSDRMTWEVCLVYGPFGMQTHVKDIEPFFLLLRNNRI